MKLIICLGAVLFCACNNPADCVRDSDCKEDQVCDYLACVDVDTTDAAKKDGGGDAEVVDGGGDAEVVDAVVDAAPPVCNRGLQGFMTAGGMMAPGRLDPNVTIDYAINSGTACLKLAGASSNSCYNGVVYKDSEGRAIRVEAPELIVRISYEDGRLSGLEIQDNNVVADLGYGEGIRTIYVLEGLNTDTRTFTDSSDEIPDERGLTLNYANEDGQPVTLNFVGAAGGLNFTYTDCLPLP